MALETDLASLRRWVRLTPQSLTVNARAIIHQLLDLADDCPPSMQTRLLDAAVNCLRASVVCDHAQNARLYLVKD